MYWNDIKRIVCILTTFLITTHTISTNMSILPVEEALIHIIKQTFHIRLDNGTSEKMVERHMQRCRNKIKILDYCLKNSFSEDCSYYLVAFLYYHEVSLFDFIDPNEFNNRRLEECKIGLLEYITIIKQAFNIQDIDVTQELTNMCSLCDQFNKNYYESLGIIRRLQFSRSVRFRSSLQADLHRIRHQTN